MKLKKAFILSYYNVYEGRLSLSGRVLKNLKRGDTLYTLDYADFTRSRNFIIEKIKAYRYELDEISEGMTCELIVSGKSSFFEEDCLFYVEDW